VDFGKGERNEMDAFTLLKNDHKKVAGLMDKIDESTERAVKTRDELFAQLKSELDIHAKIEETILYPVLEKADTTHDITLEAFEEHRIVKQLLSELESEPKDAEEWTAKFTVLKENVEHHVEEEEGEMFKKARKVLSDEELEALGARLEEAKGKQKAAGAK
jgi:hemerythrin-like domain-containing protein